MWKFECLISTNHQLHQTDYMKPLLTFLGSTIAVFIIAVMVFIVGYAVYAQLAYSASERAQFAQNAAIHELEQAHNADMVIYTGQRAKLVISPATNGTITLMATDLSVTTENVTNAAANMLGVLAPVGQAYEVNCTKFVKAFCQKQTNAVPNPLK
jgi:hypothetical protein